MEKSKATGVGIFGETLAFFGATEPQSTGKYLYKPTFS